jgi:outer membrane protein W
MKMKKLLGIVVLSFVMVLVSQSSFAQEAKKFAFGARVSYNIFQDDEIELFNTNIDTEYDSSVSISADFTYLFNESFSLELSLGYLKTDMTVSRFGDKLGYGELTQIPILLTGRYHFSVNDKVMPYIGLGVGYYLNDMEDADGNGDFFDDAPSGVNSFADDAFGFHLAGGVEYFVTDNVALNLDLKYVLLSTTIGFDGAGYDENDSTTLNSFVFGIGAKYYF